MAAIGKKPLPLALLLFCKRQLPDDTRNEVFLLIRIVRVHVSEPAPLPLPAGESDAFSGRQESLAINNGVTVPKKPLGNLVRISDDGGDEDGLGLVAEHHA